MLASRRGSDATRVAEIAAEVAPAVVGISGPAGPGSGFVVGAQQRILTAASLVGTADSVLVTPAAGGPLYAPVVDRDSASGLAVVGYPFKASGTLELGSAAQADPGGFAVMVALVPSAGRVVDAGWVHSVDASEVTGARRVRVSLVRPPTLGAPIVAPDGRVIAIVVDSSASGWAAAAGTALTVLDRDGRDAPPPATLGLRAETLEPSVAGELSLGAEHGVVVRWLDVRGPAHRAGIRTGDVLTEVAEAKIWTVEDLVSVLATKRPGVQVQVVGSRGGARKTFTVVLGKASG